jgi:hypothetical protein
VPVASAKPNNRDTETFLTLCRDHIQPADNRAKNELRQFYFLLKLSDFVYNFHTTGD